MANEKPILVQDLEVMCDGPTENPTLGHPRIYLHIQHNNRIDCPYCGKAFVYEPPKD